MSIIFFTTKNAVRHLWNYIRKSSIMADLLLVPFFDTLETNLQRAASSTVLVRFHSISASCKRSSPRYVQRVKTEQAYLLQFCSK